MSSVTGELLLRYGFTYDHSMALHDFLPFYARVGDTWTRIDYSREASEWMKQLVRGKHIDLVEISANWYLDDLPPMMSSRARPTATASSTRATSSSCGEISSTGSTARWTTRCSRSPSTRMFPAARRCS
jgi:hypothetical protein